LDSASQSAGLQTSWVSILPFLRTAAMVRSFSEPLRLSYASSASAGRMLVQERQVSSSSAPLRVAHQLSNVSALQLDAFLARFLCICSLRRSPNRRCRLDVRRETCSPLQSWVLGRRLQGEAFQESGFVGVNASSTKIGTAVASPGRIRCRYVARSGMQSCTQTSPAFGFHASRSRARRGRT